MVVGEEEAKRGGSCALAQLELAVSMGKGAKLRGKWSRAKMELLLPTGGVKWCLDATLGTSKMRKSKPLTLHANLSSYPSARANATLIL
eukprot:SAG31_NODE_13426_length_870_cov_1.130999_1_plen_88_part_01